MGEYARGAVHLPLELVMLAAAILLSACQSGTPVQHAPAPTMLAVPASPLAMGPRSDPRLSYAMGLLARPDVRAELRITPDQYGVIARARQAILLASMPDRPQFSAPAVGGDAVAAARANMEQAMAERTQWLTRTSAALDGELPDGVMTSLTAAQVGRLHELDLQWRGPLALAAPSVRSGWDLSANQAGGIADALRRYLAAEDQVREAYTLLANPGARPNPTYEIKPARPGQRPRRRFGPPPPDQNEYARRYSAAVAHAADVRKLAEAQALAELNPAQLRRWQSAVGKAFSFAP